MPSTKIVSAAKVSERERLLSSALAFHENHHVFLKATATEIVSRIRNKEWTASQVLEAYIARAVFAQERTNCVTEVLFEQAREHAKELDLEFAATGNLRGPLHGVPMSVKDMFNIKGLDSTIGLSTWANKPASADASIVALLTSLGAVPFIKTNVPQTLLSFECNNPLWGRTTNPYSSSHTCGGSSGGEAAILSMDGSALGLGSDIGGSLRIPVGFCGIYSLKPGKGRVSLVGIANPTPGFEGIPAVCGPMGRSVDDIELFCKSVFGKQDPTDDIVVPLPFREVQLPKKLKFGYYFTNGFCKESPAARRAVQETVDALRKEGHECVEFVPPSSVEAEAIFLGLVSSDGFNTTISYLGPDSLDPSLYAPVYGTRIPSLIRSLVSFILSYFLSDRAYATLLNAAGKKPMEEYMEWIVKRDEFNQRFYETVWNAQGFDGIIGPILPVPQIENTTTALLNCIVAGTCYWNVIDSPVGIVPVTRVDPSVDSLTDEWTKAKTKAGFSSQIESLLYKKKKPMYDVDKMVGMPVSVQIVGRRWQEEKVVGMMKVVDSALEPKRGFGPGAWDAWHAEKVE